MKGFQVGHKQLNTGRTHFKKGCVSTMKGKNHTPEAIEKIRKSLVGRKAPVTAFKKGQKPHNYRGGKPRCLDCEKQLSTYKSKYCVKHMHAHRLGRNHPNWKGGVSVNVHSTKEPRYKLWRNSVFERDGWKCKICESKKQLQAHHILRWADFPELRYDINNGITLCLAHHPRKRAEEKRLSPYFQELVSVSKELPLK